MRAWGTDIGAAVGVPVVFALRGELGAGKSVFARAMARGAGVLAPMPSPTFNLMFQYDTPHRMINHLDLYRLEDESEVWELGWRDLGTDNQIVMIEWPERAESLLPAPRWDVYLEPSSQGSHLRTVVMKPVGDAPLLPLPRT